MPNGPYKLKQGCRTQPPFFFLVILLMGMAPVGCVNKQLQLEEYSLARAALQAAENNEASRYSPKSFALAQRYMKKGEKAFKDQYFSKSMGYFRKSRYYSEKAENISRVQMFSQQEE